MKLWSADYSLTPTTSLNAKTSLNPRSGFLLKVQWGLDEIGYSDVFPWPEFGDPSVQELKLQISEQKKLHSLIQSSLYFNREDARARRLNRSLFLGLALPKAHGLLGGEDPMSSLLEKREDGFIRFKTKASSLSAIKSLVDALLPHEKLRLDFNAQFTFSEFKTLWIELSEEQQKKVDLIEDPWSPKKEEPVSDLHFSKMPLAADFSSHPLWRHRVLKPARSLNVGTSSPGQRLIFTHSLDHPVGQAFALWFATLYQRSFPHAREIHGVFPHFPYEKTQFSDQWTLKGGNLKAPIGMGVGFDEVLKEQRWISL